MTSKEPSHSGSGLQSACLSHTVLHTVEWVRVPPMFEKGSGSKRLNAAMLAILHQGWIWNNWIHNESTIFRRHSKQFKPRTDVTRSLKQGRQLLPKEDLCLPNIIKKTLLAMIPHSADQSPTMTLIYQFTKITTMHPTKPIP